MELCLMLCVGIFIGIWISYATFYRKIIGTLRMTRDEYDGEMYLYAELDRPYIPKHKYVIMRVDRSRK